MLTTYRTPILPEWVDYNDHLRDAFYLLIFSYATDALMTRIGLDQAGRERSGHTQVYHGLYRAGEERLLAANEQMLINIDRQAGRSAPFDPAVLIAVRDLYEAQQDLPRPIHVGRAIGLPG